MSKSDTKEENLARSKNIVDTLRCCTKRYMETYKALFFRNAVGMVSVKYFRLALPLTINISVTTTTKFRISTDIILTIEN